MPLGTRLDIDAVESQQKRLFTGTFSVGGLYALQQIARLLTAEVRRLYQQQDVDIERLNYLDSEKLRLENALLQRDREFDRIREMMYDDIGQLLAVLGLPNTARPESPHRVMLDVIAAVRTQAYELASRNLFIPPLADDLLLEFRRRGINL